MFVPQMNSSRPRTVIAVAGLDPTGGAGLVRDILTGAALGVHVIAVGTAWTLQSTDSGVVGVEPRDPDAVCRAVADALRQAAAAGRAGAAVSLKVGMVPGATVAGAIVAALEREGFTGPVVVDPVLFASRGGRLWQDEPQAMLPLLRRATLVTPNAPEAAAMSGRSVASVADAVAAAAELRRQGVAAVLVKGGHLTEGATVTDVLVGAEGAVHLSRPRLPGASPRGTGCALSTAIAAELAAGASLGAAVAAGTGWLASRLTASVLVNGQRHLPS